MMTADAVTERTDLRDVKCSFRTGEDEAMRVIAQSYAAVYPATGGIPGVQRFFDDATTQPMEASIEAIPEPIQLALRDALSQEAAGDPTAGFQILLGAFAAVVTYAEATAEFDVAEYLRLTDTTHVNPKSLSVAEIDAYLAARNRASQQARKDWMASWDALARTLEGGRQTAIGNSARALPPGTDHD